MKYFWTRFSKPIKAALLFTLLFGAAFLVLLYYLGYYDFPFLAPYKDQLDMLRAGESVPFGQQKDPFAALSQSLAGSLPGADNPSAAEPDGTEPGSVGADPEGTASASAEPVPAEKEPPVNLRLVYSTDELPDARVRVPSVSELLAEGRTYSDAAVRYVPGKNMLGKMTFDFQLPELYTETWRHAVSYKLVRVEPDNEDSELISKKVIYLQERPKVDLYMGYILIENGDSIVVVSSDGEPLCSYTTKRYTPAYARDREDRPLFTRERNNGTIMYFHLSDDGKNFVLSDYDPIRDSRGLNFDYPPDYGRSDTEKIYVEQDPETGLFGYRTVPEDLPAETADKEKDKDEKEPSDAPEDGAAPDGEKTEAEEVPPAPEPGYLTPYQFRSALPFSGGVAVVTAGEPTCTYHYVTSSGKPLFPYNDPFTLKTYGEKDGSFINNSGQDYTVLYFIGEDGKPIFPSGRMFYNEQERRVFAVCQPPYSDGIDSIGSYYFDNGLVRVRRQIIDFWRYFIRIGYTGAQVRVTDEYDALVRTDGTEFELPVGFKLEGYSEGRLLLSREGKYGILSVTGEWIAQPIFADGGPFIGGLAPLKTEDGRWGMIDTEGNIVLPFTYDSISQVSSGLVACWREENGWSVLRIME